MKEVCIIGGCNYDITAFSYNPLIEKDSNIGNLVSAPGGVSRNVAVDLSYLKDNVTFLTAIGDDAHGNIVKAELQELGINVLNITSNYPTSTYLAIHNNDGDLKVAICAADIYDKMKSIQLLPYISILKKYSKIVIDTNLNIDILDTLFTELPNTDFLVEGVSANKIIRLRESLSKIHLLKCNIIEARHLINKESSTKEIVQDLLNYGVKQVIISQGNQPIYIGEQNHIEAISIPKVKHIVNTSGAGDGLFAGVLHYLYQNKPLKDAVEFGIKVSQMILQSSTSTSKNISALVNKY